MNQRDSLVIGYDIGGGEEYAALTVVRHCSDSITVVNTFFGEEAVQLYRKLTGG